MLLLKSDPGQNVRALLSNHYWKALVSDWLSLLYLETEESKGGEGRDSGERGPFPEDGEGGGEGSAGREESLVQGAKTDLSPPAQLPWRHEVLSAEGQPLHSQQGPGAGRNPCGRGPVSSTRTPDRLFLPRAHPQGTGALKSVSTSPAPSSPPARDNSSVPHPDDRPPL